MERVHPANIDEAGSSQVHRDPLVTLLRHRNRLLHLLYQRVAVQEVDRLLRHHHRVLFLLFCL